MRQADGQQGGRAKGIEVHGGSGKVALGLQTPAGFRTGLYIQLSIQIIGPVERRSSRHEEWIFQSLRPAKFGRIARTRAHSPCGSRRLGGLGCRPGRQEDSPSGASPIWPENGHFHCAWMKRCWRGSGPGTGLPDANECRASRLHGRRPGVSRRWRRPASDVVPRRSRSGRMTYKHLPGTADHVEIGQPDRLPHRGPLAAACGDRPAHAPSRA